MRFTLSNNAKVAGICALSYSLVTTAAFTNTVTESKTRLSPTCSPHEQEHTVGTVCSRKNHNFLLTTLHMVNEFFPDEPSSSSSRRNDKKKGRRLGKQEEDGKNSKKRTKFSGRFAVGEELVNLRMDLEILRDNLRWAEAMEDLSRVEDLQKAIEIGETRDPDIVYKKAHHQINQLKTMKIITQAERETKIEKLTRLMEETRNFLPQFQLEGLWEGK